MALQLCPKCGGAMVSVGERTGGFSGTKAVVGAIVAGPVGVAAGALGKKLITLRCEKCGYTVETNEKSAQAAEEYGAVYAPLAQIQRDLIIKQMDYEQSQPMRDHNAAMAGIGSEDDRKVMSDKAWANYREYKAAGKLKSNSPFYDDDVFIALICCLSFDPVTLVDIKNMLGSLLSAADAEKIKSVTLMQLLMLYPAFGDKTLSTMLVKRPYDTNGDPLRYPLNLSGHDHHAVRYADSRDIMEYEKVISLANSAKSYDDFETVADAFKNARVKGPAYSTLFENLANEQYDGAPKQLPLTLRDNKWGPENIPIEVQVGRWRMLAADSKKLADEAAKQSERQSEEWKNAGLCPLCGGKIGGLITKNCKSCGKYSEWEKARKRDEIKQVAIKNARKRVWQTYLSNKASGRIQKINDNYMLENALVILDCLSNEPMTSTDISKAVALSLNNEYKMIGGFDLLYLMEAFGPTVEKTKVIGNDAKEQSAWRLRV